LIEIRISLFYDTVPWWKIDSFRQIFTKFDAVVGFM